jgi:hypothetical protein
VQVYNLLGRLGLGASLDHLLAALVRYLAHPRRRGHWPAFELRFVRGLGKGTPVSAAKSGRVYPTAVWSSGLLPTGELDCAALAFSDCVKRRICSWARTWST